MKYFFVEESPLPKEIKISGDADSGVGSLPFPNGGKAKYLES
jgi:hypothetical protein